MEIVIAPTAIRPQLMQTADTSGAPACAELGPFNAFHPPCLRGERDVCLAAVLVPQSNP